MDLEAELRRFEEETSHLVAAASAPPQVCNSMTLLGMSSARSEAVACKEVRIEGSCVPAMVGDVLTACVQGPPLTLPGPPPLARSQHQVSMPAVPPQAATLPGQQLHLAWYHAVARQAVPLCSCAILPGPSSPLLPCLYAGCA